ncbi:cytochrome P450 [Mycena maculata]|uniref:Cytochrome P450 n=1 Tax=Mycena maculata TaxID=230809 RepID=A0AAD7I008_9AGAR|nr:cytochrome P450 [Mycena maculata]
MAPQSTSRIFGLSREIMESPDSSVVYEDWAARYGPVYEIPVVFGRKKFVLTDPKALVHFYQSERSVYVRTAIADFLSGKLYFGRGVLWAEGDMHKRQRKALTPAFSNAAIRRLTAVFYNSTYKLKSFWDPTLESAPDGAIIEVQEWMNRIALDSIGIAGFSHDFRYLEGQQSAVTTAFESLQATRTTFLSELIFMLAFTFPFLLSIPTPRMRLFWELRRSLNVIAERLLAKTRDEQENNVAEGLTDKSVIGLLLKAEVPDAELYMTQEEVVAQVQCSPFGRWVQRISLSNFANPNLPGYETTSVSLTWALIELARHPEMQDKLREELTRFGPGDPTWDQLVSELHYLDALVLEVLRMYPPLPEALREAAQDDVIPLGTPIVTPSGELVSSIAIAKGSVILAPTRCINRSEALWGPDAKEFKPERWFEVKKEMKFPAKDLQGHHHLLTFHDGPRTCLGKSFALAARHFIVQFLISHPRRNSQEYKAALFVLVRNFVFEFPDGPGTKIETHTTIIPRPKVVGQSGAKVPLRVGRVE